VAKVFVEFGCVLPEVACWGFHEVERDFSAAATCEINGDSGGGASLIVAAAKAGSCDSDY
jgi:hypothetical protein